MISLGEITLPLSLHSFYLFPYTPFSTTAKTPAGTLFNEVGYSVGITESCALGVGEGVLGLMFAGYVLLASQSPYPIKVYFLANYRPHLSHFLENVIFAIPT